MIARAIAGSQDADRAVSDAARLAAAAELDLVRIRKLRLGLLTELGSVMLEIGGAADRLTLWDLAQEGFRAGLFGRELVRIIKERQKGHPSSRVRAIILELARIERYERRAMSRRKSLLRALETLRLPSPQACS